MRKITKQVNIGGVLIGNGNKIAVQTMTNTKLSNIADTLEQIASVKAVGCNICRVAVFDKNDADSISKIVDSAKLPIVADIHFNPDFAIKSIESGVSKIRINPANIPHLRLLDVIDCAKSHSVPIRIGVNGGSVDKDLMNKYGDKSVALTESVKQMVKIFEDRGFFDIVLSAKSSDVAETVAINTKLSANFDYPLHIGLTEAGVIQTGIVRNTVAISQLLQAGIGDTVRVSLTASPVDEVIVAKNILQTLGYPEPMVKFVSCPKCGRCQIDLEKIANEIYEYCKNIPLPITIAVMGCEVNGPGECADADLGLAGGSTVTFFKKGEIYKRVKKEDAVAEFKAEIDRYIRNVK